MRELVVGMNVKLLKEITIREFDGTEKILAGVGATGKIVFVDNDEDCLQDCLVEWNGGFFEKGEAWYMPSEIKVDEDSKSGFWWVNSDYLIEKDPQAKEEENPIEKYKGKRVRCLVDNYYFSKGAEGTIVNILSDDDLSDCYVKFDKGEFIENSDNCWYCDIERDFTFVKEDKLEGIEAEISLEDFISEFSEFMKELRSEENDKEENIEEEPKREIKVGDVVRAKVGDEFASTGAIGIVRAIDGDNVPYYIEWIGGNYKKIGKGMVPYSLEDKIVKDGTWWTMENRIELYELEDCVA